MKQSETKSTRAKRNKTKPTKAKRNRLAIDKKKMEGKKIIKEINQRKQNDNSFFLIPSKGVHPWLIGFVLLDL